MKLMIVIASVLAAIFTSPFFLSDPPILNDISSLPKQLQKWHERGNFMKVGKLKMFYLYEHCKIKSLENPPTFAVVHGFPSSSFEYHKVLDELLNYGNVFIVDHVGFGFSDKPTCNYTYSIADAADNLLTAWRNADLKNVHVVAHDMGDTIVTEVLARRYKNLLPSHFDDFFRSVTFTNGGMKYSSINFRLGQILAKNVYFGSYFTSFATRLGISDYFMKSQMRSIWGPNVDGSERDRDIRSICLLNHFNGGTLLSHKTIYYLWDRAHFEYRWFDALAHIDLPTRFVWGDSDAVSPVEIPFFFEGFVPNAEFAIVKDAGHFFMLEQPQAWIREVTKVVT